jgi:hypothetical protein
MVTAGLTGIVVFAAIAAIGSLLYFTVLRPGASSAAGGGSSTVAGGPIPEVTQGPTSPPSPASSEPTEGQESNARGPVVEIRICHSVDRAGHCRNPYPSGPSGWPIPRDTPSLVVWVRANPLKTGDRVTVQYVDTATRQVVPGPTSWPTADAPGDWWFWDTWTLRAGNIWNPTSWEIEVSYNGRLVTGFERPPVFSFVKRAARAADAS